MTCHHTCRYDARAGPHHNEETSGAAGRTDDQQRAASDGRPWRNAFRSLANAALHLHRMRELRGQMLSSALDRFDKEFGDD